MTEPQNELSRIGAALLAASDVVYEWDLRSDELSWFGDTVGLLAIRPSDMPGTIDTLKGRINPQDLPARLLAFSDHMTSGAVLDCEYRLRLGDGSFCWVHERGSMIRDASGAARRFAGVLRVIDNRKQHEAQLEYLADYDDLTGFYNRKRLRESLTETLAQAERYGESGGFLAIGIDKLAIMAEGYGHAAVDAAMLAAAQRLEACLRASDILGRIGSEQFGVVLTRCPVADIDQVKNKLLAAFREFPLSTPLGRFPVTVSIGSIAFPTLSNSAADIIGKAELAMQQARNRGGDRADSYVFSEEKQQQHRINVGIGEEVLQALRDDRLSFAFQPVVDARHDEIAFYEALMRMQAPDGSIVPAGEFMRAIEELGLHRVMDQHGLELAVAELRGYPELKLAINISSLTLGDAAWLRRLSGLLRHDPETAGRLIIEITETAAMQDLEESVRFVNTVRDLGCRVAIDDFGSGYTSFRQLRALTVDLLKIDGSFIRNVRSSESNQLFVRTLIDLAKGFALDTVAEFIECQDDADFLFGEGITFMQGYHYGRPTMEPEWRIAEPEPFTCDQDSLSFGRLVIPRAHHRRALG